MLMTVAIADIDRIGPSPEGLQTVGDASSKKDMGKQSRDREGAVKEKPRSTLRFHELQPATIFQSLF